MDKIKNIYYECKDCDFNCKTKKEMKNHIKTNKCNKNDDKFNKKNKKTNEIFYKELKKKYMVITNEIKHNKIINNLDFIDHLKKELPELELSVRKEAFDSPENFFNRDYVSERIFCFLKDTLIVAYCFYLFYKDFNPKELNVYEKVAILQIIKNRYNYYMTCDENELKNLEYTKSYNNFDLEVLEKFKKDIEKLC
jgi:hypothetical protein